MSIVLTIVGIILLIVVHELGHFLAAKFWGVQVEEFGLGYPPRWLYRKIRGTIYSLNVLPLGGFVRLRGILATAENVGDSLSFAAAKLWKRVGIVSAGVVMNFLFGWILMSAIFMVGMAPGVIIEKVMPGSPAEIAGLKANDLIFDYGRGTEFVKFINQHRGSPMELRVNRDGQGLILSVMPRAANEAGEGPLGIVIADIGAAPQGFWSSWVSGFSASVKIFTSVFVGLGHIVKTLLTEGRLMEGFVGPVGVVSLAVKSAGLGLVFFIQLLAVISLNLAALNVFPFPALDGGWLLLTLIEKIKGSRLSSRVESVINAIGLALLLTLVLAVTIRDVGNLW